MANKTTMSFEEEKKRIIREYLDHEWYSECSGRFNCKECIAYDMLSMTAEEWKRQKQRREEQEKRREEDSHMFEENWRLADDSLRGGFSCY